MRYKKSTAYFFEQVESEMSYLFRFEKVAANRKFELIKYNAKRDGTIREFIGEDNWPKEEFDVLVVSICYMSAEAMLDLNTLIEEKASASLWSVHFERSTVASPNDKNLGKFFDLINKKPLIDLKLDSLNGLSESDLGDDYHKLA